MKKLRLTILLMLTLPVLVKAQNTQLSGSMQNVNGSGFNGQLSLSLSTPGSALSSCSAYGGPVQVTPNEVVTITITNGSMVNAPKVWGADCLYPSGIPYNILVTDSSGNKLYNDQWLISGLTFDIGTAQSIIPGTATTQGPYLPLIGGTLSGLFTAPGIIDSGLISGSNPICANGIGGAFTNVGCAGGGSGGGTVTSFSSTATVGSLLTTSVASATSTPAQTIALSAAAANTVFAGPASGSSAAGSYRALVANDIPALGYLPIGGGTMTGGISLPYISGGSLYWAQTTGPPIGIGPPNATATVLNFNIGSTINITPVSIVNNALIENNGYIGFGNNAYQSAAPTANMGSFYSPLAGTIDANSGASDTYDATLRLGTLSASSAVNTASVNASVSVTTPILFGNATAPTGACTVNGQWEFTQDGVATRCLALTWTPFLPPVNAASSWDNIATVQYSGIMTTNTYPFKTCYVGSTVCSGGVGTNAPASTPTNLRGQNSPSASTGTSNAVGIFTLQSDIPNAYTDALWTTTGGGLGTNSTSTNFSREFWVKVAFASGTTNIEFDTYAFDNGWDWMWGYQCNGGTHLIQYDNQGNGWINTSAACGTLYDGNWHHIQQTMHRDLAGTNNCASSTAPCVYYDTFSLDGNITSINASLPAVASSWLGSGGQWQLDMDPTTASSGAPATDILYVDTDTVQAGTAPVVSGANGAGGTVAGTGNLASYNFDSSTAAGVGLTAVGSPVYAQTLNYHSSPDAAAFPAGDNYFTAYLSGPTSSIYSRQYIYISSIGTNANGFLRYYNGSAEIGSWYLSATSGVITYYNQAAATNISSGFALTIGTIHLVETYTNISPTAGSIIVKVDGTVVYTSATNLNTGASGLTVTNEWFGQIGATAPAGWGTTYMDNVDFGDAGWIGPI